MPVRNAKVAALLLLALFLILLIGVSRENSAIFEENNHLSAGYYFLKTNDYRMGPGHPPLTYQLPAVPLLFYDIKFPFDNSYCQSFLYYACANEFLYNSDVDNSMLLMLSRLPMIFLALFTGFFVFLWAKELYGERAGLIALFFYILSPVVLAWSGLIMTDFSVAAFSFISTFYFWRLLTRPGWLHLTLTGFFFGLAQASKFTALILIPIYFVIAAFWFLSSKRYTFRPFAQFVPKSVRNFHLIPFLTSFIAIFIIAFIVVWASYGFDVGTYSSGAPPRYLDLVSSNLDSHIPPDSTASKISDFLLEKAVLPFPSYFVGVSEQLFISVSGAKPAFFLGQVHEGSVWQFHVVEFLIKTPLAFLILLAISLSVLLADRKVYKHDVLFLVVPVLLFSFSFVFLINVGSGIQHILPIFPFLFVFASRLVQWRSAHKWIILVALLWYGVASLSAYPHYLSYFNELVDDEEGYHYYLGSNLDSGQNLPGLSKFLAANQLSSIKLSYFGTTDPKAYLEYEYLPSPFFLPWTPSFAPSQDELASNYTEHCTPTKGLLAVSITNREGVFLKNKSCYSWLEEYKPIEIIGNTIFVYNIS